MISVPFRIFNLIGFINNETLNKIITGKLFSSFSTIINWLGLVIGIVTGWDSFIKILNKVF